jgi:hypothetical protein
MAKFRSCRDMVPRGQRIKGSGSRDEVKERRYPYLKSQLVIRSKKLLRALCRPAWHRKKYCRGAEDYVEGFFDDPCMLHLDKRSC